MTVTLSSYLVEQKKVTIEQMLHALLEQSRLLPTMEELVYKHGLLSRKDLYRILSHQQTYDLDFHESAESLGLWNSELSNKIYKQLHACRKSIGKILVDMGVLTPEELISVMESFGEFARTKDPLYSNHQEDPTKLGEKSPPQILDKTLSENYVSSFEGNSLPNIQAFILSMQSSHITKEECIRLVKNILIEFVSIRSLASSLGAKQSTSIAESTIAILKDYVLTEGSVETSGIISILQSATRILHGLCQYLKDFQTESLLYEDLNMKDLIERFWMRMNKMQIVLKLILELQESEN